jgi:thiol-disulfide isomerase/thioredoxin
MFVFAAVAAVAVLAVFYDLRHPHYRMIQTGDRLVPFRVSSLYGDAHTVTATGRPQLINVFATWCPPCRAETPLLTAAARDLQKRGVEIVAIDQQESASQVARFAQEFHLPYPVYIDDSGVTHQLLGARIIPMTIYVDSSGLITWEHAGPLDVDDLRAVALYAGRKG